MNTPALGLGAAIRARRIQIEGLSQRALGEAAGYKGGSNAAAVAISRIESGQMTPGPEKLKDIARELGVDLPTLLREASAASDAIERSQGSDAQVAPLTERLDAVERERQRRTRLIEDLGNRFKAVHDDARDHFFLRFLDVATTLADPLESPAQQVSGGKGLADLNEQALYLASLSSGAANSSASVAGGTTRVPARELSLFTALMSGPLHVAGIDAARALLSSRRGMAGAAGAYVFLPAVVVPAAVVAAVVSHREITRRSKQKEAELAAKVASAEDALTATGPGFEALVQTMTHAAAVLEYIAVHAAHAFDRWASDLPKPVDAESLSANDAQRYRDFRAIAGCQMNVARIDLAALMTVPEGELEPLVNLARETLDFAQQTVEALV